MFEVFENNRPATSKEFGFKEGFGFDCNKFDTFDEAKFYAILWAYPYTSEEAKEAMKSIDIEINVPKSLSMSEFPVMMEIRKIEN